MSTEIHAIQFMLETVSLKFITTHYADSFEDFHKVTMNTRKVKKPSFTYNAIYF